MHPSTSEKPCSNLKPLSNLSHPLEVIRQFTPNWFTVNMGTGILALALVQFPIQFPGLGLIAEALWLFNIVLFILFSGLYLARWVIYFDEARRIFGHSTVSMFFGAIPMGLAVIINGFLAFGVPRWGMDVIPIAECLWWLDVGLSLMCGVVIPYMMFTRQQHSLDQMTGVWLLPVVAAEVAATSGGLLAPYLGDADLQLRVIVTSYVLWAYSVPVAFSILSILLLRMALHKLPHENMAASCWLALGPIGTGAMGMLVIGGNMPALTLASSLTHSGEMAVGIGLILGMVLWGCGLWWFLMALLITRRYFRNRVPFNLGWWAYTFPLGVYSLATLKLGAILNLAFFKIFGAILVIALLILWLIVVSRTLAGAYRGTLFVSPCIAEN